MKLDRLFRLKNSIQNYSWGSCYALGELFGVANPSGEPQAEIWMGAHPKAPSLVVVGDGQDIPLDELIRQYPEHILGTSVARQFDGRLPYLFKVLSAAEPLSIQAHPDKFQAEQGFQRENGEGIPLSAPFRNYKDDNHKPELIYALTLFKAMNGFRPIEQIIENFRWLDNRFVAKQLDDLITVPTEAGLKHFYGELMQLESDQRQAVIKDALAAAKSSDHTAFQTLSGLAEKYPDDIGVLSPLLLNVVELQPGEAMFLDAGTLHAYLEGTGLEVMASSDNVLRGGLTLKHVDVSELLATIRFQSMSPEAIKLKPVAKGQSIEYPVPVNDFSFSILIVDDVLYSKNNSTVELLFCKEGSVTVQTNKDDLLLSTGEACLIPAGSGYRISGKGALVTVGCSAN